MIEIVWYLKKIELWKITWKMIKRMKRWKRTGWKDRNKIIIDKVDFIIL